MRFRYRLRTLLLVVTSVAILLGCGSYFYSIHELESRRKHTLERLGWSGVDDRHRNVRNRLVKAVQASTRFSLQKPELVAVFAQKHRDLGYVVVASWISHAPIADGMQITFSDGSESNIGLWEPWLEENESTSDRGVLFQGSVYRDEFPAPANRTELNDLVSVALLSGDSICSNSLPVDVWD
jgi:hypothetical protein